MLLLVYARQKPNKPYSFFYPVQIVWKLMFLVPALIQRYNKWTENDSSGRVIFLWQAFYRWKVKKEFTRNFWCSLINPYSKYIFVRKYIWIVNVYSSDATTMVKTFYNAKTIFFSPVPYIVLKIRHDRSTKIIPILF